MIHQIVQRLIDAALSAGLMEKEDEIYSLNQLLSLLHETDFIKKQLSEKASPEEIPDLLEQIVNYACEQGVIENQFDEREIFASQVMNILMARPSTINDLFWKKYKRSPKSATRYFYELSKNSQYIQMQRIRQNIEFKVPTDYGELDVTINLSKPEKDPKSIAREQEVKQITYPKCLLCIENEGYAGRIGHPARSNHRMIRMNLMGDAWYFQYSPYVYYHEHCIVLAEKHTKMEINCNTLQRLVSFVETFPHYFLGSNADLPIVGGSILSHDHYQGGNYEFAMANAEEDWEFEMERFPHVQSVVVKWPMSVIRLRSKESGPLVEAGSHILERWKNYNDEAVDILAWSGETPHNTITPIARKREDFFELDLVLRNNRTNDEHPLGIFHPHSDIHHIKKENIGLIEVMGLAVLPARLKNELMEVESYILGKKAAVADYHLEWAECLKRKYGTMAAKENIETIMQKEIGKLFLRGLEDAGVFKRNPQGQAAFKRFLAQL